MDRNETIPLIDDAYCFVCGKQNLNGLQMDWKTEGPHAEAEFYPNKQHQGYAGVVHGGILAAVLDEGITRLAWKNYGGAMTAEICVRYFNPARIGEKLVITSDITGNRGRLITGRAEIRTGKGRLIATATGKALKPKNLLP